MTKIILDYKKFSLDNGLSFLYKNTPTHTIYGQINVNHGSLNEKKGEEGIAHMLEHTIILGGNKEHGPEDINKKIAELGEFDAETYLDHIAFTGGILPEEIESYFKLMHNILFYPIFDKKIVNEEKNRILREIYDTKSEPTWDECNKTRDLVFRDSPHNYFQGGKDEVIKATTVDDLKNFHRRGYNPNNMNIILVGNIPKNIEYLVNEYFSKIPEGLGKKFEFEPLEPLKEQTILHTYAPDLINNEKPEESSAFFELDLIFPSINSEDFYSIVFLDSILGGGLDSRLFKSIAQRKGLAYTIGSNYDTSDNKGLISILGKISSSRSEEVFDTVFDEFKIMQKKIVESEDIEKRKKSVIYNYKKRFESNDGIAQLIKTELYTGMTSEKYLEGLNRVSPESIREVANKYLPKTREEGKYVLLLRDPLKKN